MVHSAPTLWRSLLVLLLGPSISSLLPRAAADQLPRLSRLPWCEEHVGLVAQQDLLALRDTFQLWLMYKRIAFDMQNQLNNMRNPPQKAEDIAAWRTNWTQEYVDARMNYANANITAMEAKAATIITRLRSEGVIKPSTTSQDLMQCTAGHLQPRLFPDLPVVSFMLQYFKRPKVIDKFVDMLQVCAKLVPSEFLVNVDSPAEGQRWADLSYATNGFVVPVMSYNLHELRGYNRLAGMARGRYLVLLQDDDLVVPADCSWLPKLVAQFDAMPNLAMVGLNRLQLGHGEGNNLDAHQFSDPNTGHKMIFAFQVDLAPLAIRRTAYKHVGGLDEGMSDRGECGIWSDWELSIRLWTAGWHVAFMPLIGKAPDGSNEPGGTHKPETGVRCWGRQQNVASAVYMARWGGGWGSGPGAYLDRVENLVRIANLRYLKGAYTNCPFRKGCECCEGNPKLPDKYNYSYQHPTRLVVDA